MVWRIKNRLKQCVKRDEDSSHHRVAGQIANHARNDRLAAVVVTWVKSLGFRAAKKT